MTIRELPSDSFDACLLISLSEDVFALISHFLSASDIFNLSLCCKSLLDFLDSEKIWLVQCELVKALPLSEIIIWRIGVSSYKALCRFLVEVMKPLVGVWVHQNPELGNVVYVMPGFLSVVGCRIIPQKVDSLGIQEGRVMWSPVFEIICGFDGSTKFFLHGRDGEQSCLYPGLVTGINKSSNVLLLEVEPRTEKSNLCNEIKREYKSQFQELVASYRRDLLELVTRFVGLQVMEPISGKLFPSLKDDEVMFLERRTMLLKMHKFGGNWNHMNLEEEGLCYHPTQVDINKIWKKLANDDKNMDYDDRSGINHILGISSSSRNKASSSENRRSNLKDFLSSGDTFGLSLRACNTEVSFYEGWPIIPQNHWALYKLQSKTPGDNQEYAGLWGGTFGWPPGSCIDDETGNAFYLLMLTYEDSQEDSDERLLIGSKILEGTHYVNQPNGSAMFVVNISTPSLEPFPFDADGRDFEHTYTGKGISDGYGFRYPGSKPGSLYVISDDHLAFLWHETEDVFTLQRLNLDDILKKGFGLCVPPLPPTNNFTYMDMAYTNVFTES